MNRIVLILSCAFSVMAAPTQADGRDAIEGVWMNRPETVVVRIAPCGAELCGTIIQASSDAKASTSAAGTPNLIGTQVLTGFRKFSAGTYRGEVFNPNLNIQASGTITLVSPTILIVRGCVLAGLICRQQHWTRVS